MLFIMRLGGNIVALAYPFYALYALQMLGAPEAMAGTFISVLALSSVFSNILWSYIGDRYGNRLLMQWGMAASIGGPLLALLIPHVAPVRGWAAAWLVRLAPVTSSDQPIHNLYLSVFLMVGAARTALMIASLNYLLDISPATERPTYVGLMNTVSAPMMLMPMLGGYLIDRYPFEVVFLIPLIAAVLTFMLTFRLAEPRNSLEESNRMD